MWKKEEGHQMGKGMIRQWKTMSVEVADIQRAV